MVSLSIIDFQRFIHDAEDGQQYAKWAQQNPGDLARWRAYRDAILQGLSPAPPSMSTPHGRELVDAGIMCVNFRALERTIVVTPPPPTATESPDNTVVVGTSGSIVGKQGHKWAISPLGVVVVDGMADQNTSGVVRLAYEAGKVWQENQHHLWWSKVLPTDAWTPGAGTFTSPIPGALTVSITGTPKVGSTLTAVAA